MKRFSPRLRACILVSSLTLTSAAVTAPSGGAADTRTKSPTRTGTKSDVEKTPMDLDSLEYQVSELAVAPETLTIDRQGHATYRSHTNWHALDRPRMGVYRTTLPPGDVERLSSLLARPPFAGLPDHWGNVLPGDRYRRVRAIGKASKAEKLVGTKERVDPALARVLDELDRLVGMVSQHPRQVVAIEVMKPTVRSDGTLSFILALTGAGAEPVVCRNPADLVAAADNGSIAVSVWPNRPGVAVPSEDMQALKARSIKRIGPPAPASAPAAASPVPVAVGAVLELGPGETAEFRVEAALPSPPPRSAVVRVTYSNFAASLANRDLLVGELVSRTVLVSVPPAGIR
jgi:hypothetical protein